MSHIKGTVIELKKFLFNEDSEITIVDNEKKHPVIYFKKDRHLYVPDYQREIRWQKETLFTLMNDISHKVKFLGNIILSLKDEKDYQIIDGQQRLISLNMLVQYIKFNYGQQIDDIGDLVFLHLNRFEKFPEFQANKYTTNNLSSAEAKAIIESDKLHQIKSLNELYSSIDKAGILNSADKARRFIDNLRSCQINVIVADEEDIKTSTEYYIDVNLKGIKLDTEDIFKGYLLSQDSSKDIRNNWVHLKEAWINFDNTLSSLKSNGSYVLTKILEQYIYCFILQKDEYRDISIDEEFLLTKPCVINGTQYYIGDHVIKAINNNTYMKELIVGATDYIKLLTDIIGDEDGVPQSVKDLLKTVDSKERNIICNIIKKSIVDKILIVPKMLILKYYLSIKENATKNTCTGIYAVYFYIVFFMAFGDKKNDSETIKKIARSTAYYPELMEAIKSLVNIRKLTDARPTAISRSNSNYDNEELQYKCKSLATIYNYFKLKSNRVTISSADEVKSFLTNDLEYSIEHFIVNSAKNVSYLDDEEPYVLPENVQQYHSYIFNFIFIPSTINNDILKNYSVQKKVSLLNQADTMNQIKCEYSKMILEIIGDKFRDPIDVQHLDDKEKEELDKYWLVTFKREYARYTADIIDKIIERFKITE